MGIVSSVNFDEKIFVREKNWPQGGGLQCRGLQLLSEGLERDGSEGVE